MFLFYKLYTLLFIFIIDNQVSLRCNKSSRIIIQVKNLIKRRNKKSHKVRTSVAAFSLCGSMTVEAAFVLTIFMTAFLSLTSVLQIFGTYQKIQCALVSAGSEAAVLGDELPGIAGAWGLFADHAREMPLENMGIKGGVGSISFLGSSLNKDDGILELRVSYKVRPVLMMMPGISFQMRHHLKYALWNGYHGTVQGTEMTENRGTYFVAEHESVYHTSAQCTHLRLSVSAVDFNLVSQIKNDQGMTYSPCSKCCGGTGGYVYITKEGTKYHTSLSCSGLKRTVHEVHETGGLNLCSRCGGRY